MDFGIVRIIPFTAILVSATAQAQMQPNLPSGGIPRLSGTATNPAQIHPQQACAHVSQNKPPPGTFEEAARNRENSCIQAYLEFKVCAVEYSPPKPLNQAGIDQCAAKARSRSKDFRWP
jgi:hypothetical protein